MTGENWLDRWVTGRTGWHEANGNAGLMTHWNASRGTVLVPLCGKSPDLRWLADRGHEVVGVELAEVAIRDFFAEQALSFERQEAGALVSFASTDVPITIYCGDYFEFGGGSFDALYDRGALVAVDPRTRAAYVDHTTKMLRPGANKLVITLEYDQAVVGGPPFSVMPDELLGYWPDLVRIAEKDDIETCPPKFRAAGLSDIREVIWQSG